MLQKQVSSDRGLSKGAILTNSITFQLLNNKTTRHDGKCVQLSSFSFWKQKKNFSAKNEQKTDEMQYSKLNKMNIFTKV